MENVELWKSVFREVGVWRQRGKTPEEAFIYLQAKVIPSYKDAGKYRVVEALWERVTLLRLYLLNCQGG